VLSGFSGASTTSNGSGAFSFAGLTNGNYVIIPSNPGYAFTPASQAVVINGANVTGVSFTAAVAATTYTISGSITPASVGSGATVTLSGAASGSTTADSNGNFSFTSLNNGTYTITPSSTTATFSPTSQSATISNANATVSFTATATANVIFYDDFTGTALSSEWVALDRHGDYSNDELQCYLPANVTVSDSYLTILSEVQTETCGDSDHTPATWNYTSGMVQWNTFNFTYGTVEYRAKMAGGQGTWPAIWMLGANCQTSNISSADNTGACNWPQPGSDEIDITEILNSNHTSVNQGIHTVSSNSDCTATTTDVSQNWHVYDLIWAAGSLIWEIDGVQTCKLTSGIPSDAMFLMINTAMGGAGGNVNNGTLPQTLQVDYVKVTQP
jgi:beta-glucanase (GH16 family)